MADINLSKVFARTQAKLIKKGEILLSSGELSQSLFYVQKGCLRSYTIDENGKEHVFQFAPEDWIISDQEGVLNRGLSILNIDAIEDSEIKVLRHLPDRSKLDKESLLEMNEKLLRRTFSLQKRIIQLLSSSAEERYLEFLKIYPNLFQRVPQKMVASYLGLTPEGLSRVRKQLGRKKLDKNK
jgi:CRP-like cAMP-binding protein